MSDRSSPRDAQARQELDRDFRRDWLLRMNRILPGPVVAAAVFVSWASSNTWSVALWCVLYIVTNMALSAWQVRADRVDGGILTRTVVSFGFMAMICWVAGPESPGWLMAFPIAFAGMIAEGGVTTWSFRAWVIRTAGFGGVAMGSWLTGMDGVEVGAAVLALFAMAFAAERFYVPMRESWVEQEVRRRELDEKNEALERALASRQAFLANMSHEIRTPLNGVLGMAELLQGTPLDKDQEGMLEIIQDSGRGLLTVINDILDLAKLEAGRMAVEEIPFEPAPLMRSVVELLAAGTDLGRVELRTAFEKLPDALTGDPARLRQVLVNLTGNALKFTESGEVVVSARWEEDTLHVEVRDTGIGIAADRLPDLFVPFEQADATTTRRFGGTGLGLSISRRLVELMGGRLEAESVLGQGSTFRFSVHAERAAVERTVLSDTPDVFPRSSVLLVDDNAINRAVAAAMLGTLECDVVTVASGEEAVAQVDADIDLIFMDCQMPGMDGFEATERLRELGFSRPILALTAGVTKEEQERCLACGMNDVVMKPVSITDLRNAMARWGREALDLSDVIPERRPAGDSRGAA